LCFGAREVNVTGVEAARKRLQVAHPGDGRWVVGGGVSQDRLTLSSLLCNRSDMKAVFLYGGSHRLDMRDVVNYTLVVGT